MTDYVVLAGDDGKKWEELGTFSASSETVAKREALAAKRPQGGFVVAVPARSWKPEDKKPKLSFV